MAGSSESERNSCPGVISPCLTVSRVCVATGAILITYLIGYQRPIEAQPLRASALGKITVWFAGVTGVLIGISVMGGTTLHGLIDGLLLTPLLTPTIALLPIPISNLALLNVVFAAACAAFSYSRPNATPIAQAHFEPAAWFRAIYAGDAPVGFAMRYDPTRAANPERADRCFLWRLMIDARQHRNGYGAHAVRLLIAHARALPGVVAMDVSYFPGAGNPGDFYRKLGFRDTGAVDDGEVMLELGLATHE